MANVEKEMATRPARWPLDTLDACIRDFLWRRSPGGGMDVKADDIPAMCAEATSFEEAVWIACESRRRNRKMHSHQTKVTKDARREFGHQIIDRFDSSPLFGHKNPRKLEGITFDQFHDILWDIRPAGIGPLTTYDVATRVGAYLELEPDQIYLHTGARLGWTALWGSFPVAVGAWRVPPELWPASLRALSADMAEDFLCTYRDALTRIKRDDLGVPI